MLCNVVNTKSSKKQKENCLKRLQSFRVPEWYTKKLNDYTIMIMIKPVKDAWFFNEDYNLKAIIIIKCINTNVIAIGVNLKIIK